MANSVVIYILALFLAAYGIIVQAVKAVAEAAPSLEVVWDERLLVHIGYSPLR